MASRGTQAARCTRGGTRRPRRRRSAWVAAALLTPVGAAWAGPPLDPPEPPVLVEARAAATRVEGLAAAGRPGEAAEVALLLGDPTTALAVLRRAPAPPPGSLEAARQLRLELDAFVLAGDRRLAEARASALEAIPGWSAHLRGARARLAVATRVEALARGAGLVYALAFAFLVIDAGRELLRPGAETLSFAVALAGSLALARGAPPAWAAGLAMAGSATLVLVHAAAASARRLSPRPRVRLLLALTLSLGALGGSGAVAARVDPSGVAALLAR